jgi:hypothetical protein
MWDGKSEAPRSVDNGDGSKTINAQLVLVQKIDGAASEFYNLILGKSRTIEATTLNEFLKSAQGEGGSPISSSIEFYKPHDKPTRMPVREDVTGSKFRDVTWFRGVGVNNWVYVLFSEQSYRYEDWDKNSGAGLSKLTPTGKRGLWKLATRFPRSYGDAGSKGPNSWDARRTITDKTMDVVATKYTVPAALASIRQGIELLDSTCHFIPAYAGSKMLFYGDSNWDRGMGAILIAADIVPVASSIRGASRTVKTGANSFIAIGAGARIVNGIKEAADGKANLGTGIDVGIAVIEGTLYALTHVNLKMRVRGVDKLEDATDLLKMIDDAPGGLGGQRTITVADDASAEELARFFKGKRSADDIKAKGLTKDELLELIVANPAAVRRAAGAALADALSTTSLQARVTARAPRVDPTPGSFSDIRAIEAAQLRDPAFLQGLKPDELLRVSDELMGAVQGKMTELGYTTRKVLVTNEVGTKNWALQIDTAPGRFGTLMRRASTVVGKDVKYVYDPVGIKLGGGSALYDDVTKSVRMGHSVMANADAGVLAPVFHEVRHARTDQLTRLGKTDYPYQGTLLFGEKGQHPGTPSMYKDQFQVDEALTHQRQSAGTLQETKRAIGLVNEKGAAALECPRTALFAQRGASIAKDESTTARAFARVIRECGTDFLTKLRGNLTRVTTADVKGTHPAKQYTFKDNAGRDVLTIEYWIDDTGTRNAIVLAEKLDDSGKIVKGAERAVHFRLGDAPADYMGDATHSYVRVRLEKMIEAGEQTKMRALRTEDAIDAADDAARALPGRK